MAHKKKSIVESGLLADEQRDAPVANNEESVVIESDAPTILPVPQSSPVPKAIPAQNVQKKRIRFRPSQKKKLSVAVLCTNPITRRFI
jgi:hypothetical protein